LFTYYWGFYTINWRHFYNDCDASLKSRRANNIIYMKISKVAYYDVEAFHNNGKLVIQFLPEYLKEIQKKLLESGFVASEPTEVLSWKYTTEAGRYLQLVLKQIEIDYSNNAVGWFMSQDWETSN